MLRAFPLMLASVIACACTGPSARTQPSEPDGTATPTRAPQTPGVRYVAIGASDTVGVGARDPSAGSWPARVAAKLPAGATYTNVGVSGSLVQQARTEQLPRAVAARPTIVTIWLAVNDLNAGVEPTEYGVQLGAVVDALVAGTDAKIFVGNVPDLRAVPVYAAVDQQVLAARVAQYNGAIVAVAAKHAGRVVVVDLLTGSREMVSSMTVAADGFHPSDEGYALIGERFVTAMRANGVAVRP